MTSRRSPRWRNRPIFIQPLEERRLFDTSVGGAAQVATISDLYNGSSFDSSTGEYDFKLTVDQAGNIKVNLNSTAQRASGDDPSDLNSVSPFTQFGFSVDVLTDQEGDTVSVASVNSTGSTTAYITLAAGTYTVQTDDNFNYQTSDSSNQAFDQFNLSVSEQFGAAVDGQGNGNGTPPTSGDSFSGIPAQPVTGSPNTQYGTDTGSGIIGSPTINPILIKFTAPTAGTVTLGFDASNGNVIPSNGTQTDAAILDSNNTAQLTVFQDTDGGANLDDNDTGNAVASTQEISSGGSQSVSFNATSGTSYFALIVEHDIQDFPQAPQGEDPYDFFTFGIDTSTTITQVATPTPSKLVFTTEPSTGQSNTALPAVTVKIEDNNGDVITSDNSNIALALQGGPGTLSGTTSVAASAGVATFSNLQISEAGDYTLTASDATDHLSGFVSSSFNVTSPGGGNSSITLAGGTLTITGTPGNDSILIADNSGSVLVTFNGVVSQAYTGVSAITIAGGAGDDTVNLPGVPINASIGGAGGNDSITGGAGNDFIKGGAGNDTLGGAGGNDTVGGAAGNDLVKGGAGDDSLDGGSGSNTLHGSAGNDTLYTGAGTGIANGNDGNDSIYAGTGAAQLMAGPGNDTLLGSISPGDAPDTITCGGGSDSVQYSASDSILGDTSHSILHLV